MILFLFMFDYVLTVNLQFAFVRRVVALVGRDVWHGFQIFYNFVNVLISLDALPEFYCILDS